MTNHQKRLTKKKIEPWQRECGICHEIIKDGSDYAWSKTEGFYHLGCYHYTIYEQLISKSNQIRKNILQLALKASKYNPRVRA